MKKFEGLYLASDMDGTLLNDNHEIAEGNLEAIQYFMDNGGTFGIATGRLRDGISIFMDKLIYNTNAILMNGTQIYDLNNDKIVENIYMPKNSLELITDLMDKFDDFGVEVYLEKDILLCRDHKISQAHFDLLKVPYKECKITETPSAETWFKLNLTGETEYLHKINEYAQSKYSDDFAFMLSTLHFFEVTNKKAGKGPAVMKNAELLGISPDKVFTVGDNGNDLTMIKAAKIGFVPENGIKAVKDAADVIVCSNNDGAVADAIKYLEENIDSL